LDQPVTLRLRPDDGAKENYTAQLTRKLEPTVRNLDMNRQTVDLVPDSYTLTLWQQSGAERSYVLETMRRQTDISACEIVTQNAVCTGQPVTPDVKVSDNGVQLTEGSDYFVSCQQTLQETGQYILHITGNGRYCGTESVSMCILPADLTALPLLTDGEYTAKIEKPAQTVLYRWSPGTNGCISTDANMDKQFSVSQNGTVLAQTGGIGFDMLTPDTEADAVYVVAVSLRNPDETGTVRFTVQSGFRELSLCHADIPAQLPADSAGGLPAFTVKDGDTVLKEGTDYTVYASGGQDRCGRAQIILRGTGKYTGELVLEYLRYPEDPAKFALAENADDGEYEIEQLVTEEPVRLIYSLPGTVSLFRFRAADDGTYYFMLPEQNASAFVYLPDGSVLPAGQNAAALSAGDDCLILTVSDWVEPGFNRYDTFEVGVSRTAPVGDVNGDGRTDTDDALALLRWLSESEGAALQNPDAADCNADGFIDMLDVQMILRISKES
ncbi:MAG: dockerin type I repeat-containing protein, partial [Oscillospiraceae bacterium]|nr:dockerin type I repeat-containing protein [Oscillospiraceae bacterium]